MKNTLNSELLLDSGLSYYVDPEPCFFPPEMEKHVSQWKRPHEIFPPEKLTVYEGRPGDIAIAAPSRYTANYELFRFISDVCCILQFHAATEPFPVESESSHFVSNTKGQPWQPWHHIYGNSKAGKDHPHRPVYHSYGKYILRLYYLGAWRKFTVDDLVPCDTNGECMLPLTKNPGELWSILLVKAIMKISFLTPMAKLELMNLPIWTLFTGWMMGALPTENRTSEQTWRLLSVLNVKFTLPESQLEKSDSKNHVSVSSMGNFKKERKDARSEETRPVLTIAELSNFPAESGLDSKCLVAITMTRDIPLFKSRLRKSTEPWKRIRWVHWAAKKGLWTDEQLIPPYRCLYQINFTKKLYNLLYVDRENEKRLFVAEEEINQDEVSYETDDPAQWIDYYKFIKYLSRMAFLVKPSTLLSKYKLTYMDLSGNAASMTRVRSELFKQEWRNHYMLPIVKVSNNEPPMLYCESSIGIFIFISLWVSPKGAPNMRNEAQEMKGYTANLIIEKFDWRSAQQNKVIAIVNTVGYSSTYLFLNPGRHALRLWLDTDYPFVIELCANSEVIIGKGPEIRMAMSTESLAIKTYVNRLSAAFIALTQKYGHPDHGKNLAEFFRQAEPLNSVVMGYNFKIKFYVAALSASIATQLRSIITNEEELRWMVIALQSMFVDPYIPLPPMKLISRSSAPFSKKSRKEPTTSIITERGREGTAYDIMMRDWSENDVKMIITIQRMYRGYRVRQLIRFRSPSCKEHNLVVEKLKKICDVMFAPSKRDVEVARLIRETIAVRPDLLETFIFHKDLSNVTVTEEFTGKIVNVEPKTWVPIIRMIFMCHSQEPLPCTFYFSCNLDQYILSVTDNDTYEEIFRLANTTCPHYYRRNQKGYTLFVYGWNESEMKTVNWRLEMLKMKYYLDIHPCNATLIDGTGNICYPYQPQPLSVQEIRNFYVPNKNNKICTCLIKVRRRIMVTIRLSVSDEWARFVSRIYLRNSLDSDTDGDDGDKIIQAEAKSSGLIFPAVMLEHYRKGNSVEENEPTVYVLEAFVTENSWPLTKHEWGIVEPMRVNGETWQESLTNIQFPSMRKSSVGSRKKSLRLPKPGSSTLKTVESPFWSLQVVADSTPDLNTILEVSEDRSYQEMIKGIKLSWEENDPGRRQRGRLLQREFLRSIFEQAKEKSSSDLQMNQSLNFEIYRSIDGESLKEASFDTLIHEMRSFSYLVNDKSQHRYLKSPRILPWTPLNDLISKYSCGNRDSDMFTSKTNSELFHGEDYIVQDIPKASQEVCEEIGKFLTDLKTQPQVLEYHFRRENLLSIQLMEQAYEERREVIENMKSLGQMFEVKVDEGKCQKNK